MKQSDRTLRPRLIPALETQLARIEPSIWSGAKYYPCSATLKSGTKLDCIYLVAQYAYMKTWGQYPPHEIALENIIELRNSSFRLPAKFATKLYEAGESGMGYSIFTVKFSGGSTQACKCGGAVDFVLYPDAKSSADVTDVEPHVGRDANLFYAPKFSVCLYSDADTERVFPLGLTRPMEMTRTSTWSRLRTRFRRRFSSALPPE